MKFITENEDGTFTCKDSESGETKLYRLATEADRDAHARGDLKGRTVTGYKPEDFQPFLLVEVG